MTLRAFAIAAAVAMLLPAVPSRAQDTKPSDEKKPKGLLGALNGSEDPSAQRQPDRSNTKTGADLRRLTGANVVRSVPDPKRFADRIHQLERVPYSKVEPVSSLDDAKQRINRLRRRADALRRRADQQTVKEITKVVHQTDEVRGKWQEVLDAMNDGKKRTPMDWEELVRRARRSPAEREAEAPADAVREVAEAAIEAADKAVNMPTDEELESEGENGTGTEETPPGEEGDPLKPAKQPKSEKDIPPPDLADLAKAIKNHEKPVSMLPITWAKLLDEFGRDTAEIEAAVAAARKGVKDRRKAEFGPVAAALKAAQDTYSQLKSLGDEPGEAFRRHLAWRILQADLAELRLAHADMMALASERAGRQSDREPLVEMYPLDPAKTLEQIARLMEVDGLPGSPTPGQFDALKAEGLPDLYPPGSKTIVDGKVQYGNMVKANIDRYQRRLRDIQRQLADTDKIIADEDRETVRRLWSDMLHKDRLEGRADHPINRAKRRVAVKEKYRDLVATRADRVAKRKAELEKESAAMLERLQAEYKRRDAMLEAEKGPEKKSGTGGDSGG